MLAINMLNRGKADNKLLPDNNDGKTICLTNKVKPDKLWASLKTDNNI